MQLYVLDYNPQKAVEYLADCHVIKMCLETAQILSYVRFNNGMEYIEGLPKPYNPKHPVIKAINSPEKINWLLDYNKAIHQEYIYRFNKEHAYHKIVDIYEGLRNSCGYSLEHLDFARDFKDFSTPKKDLVESFKDYYRFKKSIIKRWKYSKRIEPDWMA
jgi:hypothetical protein